MAPDNLFTSLLEVDRHNLLSTDLLQVVSTSCNKFANDKCLALTDLLQLDKIDKFNATITSCNKLVKLANCNKSGIFWLCINQHINNIYSLGQAFFNYQVW